MASQGVKRPRSVPRQTLQRAVATAYAELSQAPYQGVVAVAAGHRRRANSLLEEAVVTIFVEQKLTQDQLDTLGLRRLPSHIEVGKRGKYSVPTDIIEFKPIKGTAQSLNPCERLSKSQGGSSVGVISWLHVDGSLLGFTAEHVVGFDSVGTRLFSGGREIGRVIKCGYALSNVDAVLFQVSAGEAPSTLVGGRTLGPPRGVRQSDVAGHAANVGPAHVFLPHSGILRDVQIHFIHLQGFSMTSPDGVVFQPQPLVLTDMCTVAGDSGTLLLGADFRPLGLLSGIVTGQGGNSYSCFTELASVIDTLL